MYVASYLTDYQHDFSYDELVGTADLSSLPEESFGIIICTCMHAAWIF